MYNHWHIDSQNGALEGIGGAEVLAETYEQGTLPEPMGWTGKDRSPYWADGLTVGLSMSNVDTWLVNPLPLRGIIVGILT